MAYKAYVYQVIIASPGDVPRERQIAREIVIEWNSVNSYDKKICLLPVGWEHNTSPEMGGRAQGFVNKQILKNSDLLIGIFWTRIGSPTGNFISGSVEEIEKHVEAGKPAMLYFSNAPVVLDSIDSKQYKELTKFKNKCYEKGLVESFSSIEDFRNKLTKHLSLKIIQHDYFQVSSESLDNDIKDDQSDNNGLLKDLTDSEKLLLIEASEDPSGSIIKVSYKGGFDVQTNSKRLNVDHEPRTRALWESTFDKLITKDLIEERGFKGEIFALTLLGYKVADALKEKK